MSSAIPARASRRSSNVCIELVLRTAQLARGVEVLHALQQSLGGAAVGGDLGLQAELVGVLRRILEPGEELAGELVRLGRDRAQVGDVVLEAAFLAGVEAALDAQQEQDDDQHADAERR